MPKLSVIVPVYNAEKYLDRCVESILAQTFTDFELILVDDGSPDNCPAMCDAWAEKDSRVKVIHKENGGVSSARNRGLDTVPADSLYFTFVDSDDTVDAACYKDAFDILKETPYDIYSFGINIIGPDGDNIESVSADSFVTEIISDIHPFLKEYLETSFYSTCPKIYSRKILDSGIKFNTDFKVGEDTLFNYDAFSVAEKIYNTDKAYYNYWQHENLSLARKGDMTIYDMAKRRSMFFRQFLEKIGLGDQAEEYVQEDLDTCAYSQFYQIVNPSTAIPYKDRYINLKKMYRDKEIHSSLVRAVNSAGSGIGVLLAKISIKTKLPVIVLLPSIIKKAIK